MKFEINKKEKLYFGIMSTIGLIMHISLIILTVGIYLLGIMPFLVFKSLASRLFIGYMKGNAIKINEKQFPDIFDILKSHSNKLGLHNIPDMYVLQGNGVMNAFATRIARKNFVVLYSDIFEIAYEEGKDAVSFIIGHELGHIKRKHVGFLKSFLIFPAKLIPFLNNAYSRACEYTCDNIGYHLAPEGAKTGILILAAGKKLYKKVNITSLINNTKDHRGFSFCFTELISTHPHLVKRLAKISRLQDDNLTPVR